MGGLPSPAEVWGVQCFVYGVTMKGATVLLWKVLSVSILCSPCACQANAAHGEMLAPRETKVALCYLHFGGCRKSILGNPLALTCFSLIAYNMIESLFVNEVTAVSLHWQ